MTILRKFTLQLLALAVFALALIWMSGSGVALQSSNASAEEAYNKLHSDLNDVKMILADTVNIDAQGGRNDIESAPVSGDTRESMFKNIKLFNSMAYHIKNRYMEDIDPQELIKAGIRGMLQNLDPFSVLMEEQSYDELMESTHGRYEGLGMQIDSRGERIRIISPIEGTPAYSKGLLAGDVIWEINGNSTAGMSTQDAADLMRGPAGTSVSLKIKREGFPELLDYEVERAVIALKSVNYYGYFPGTNIGYVRLSRFAEETGNELREAITDLQSQKKMEGLIFDLRSNGGGLLHQAIETANLFLDRDRLVVYTRGRTDDSERRYHSQYAPLVEDTKLVVLVNEGSASASEIVAGAIQDWDRGIIMGQDTYGKGLVQQLFPAGGDTGVALKLTTAKYYIPSGRCIQRPERSKKHGAEAETEDTALDESATPSETTGLEETDEIEATEEKEIFFTNGGRVVYGGGGIVPDVSIEPEKWEPIEINLERKSMFFDFAVSYTTEHPEIDRDFNVTDKVLDDFKTFIKEKDFDYNTALEVSLNEMRDVVASESKEQLFSASLDELEQLIEKEKDQDFKRSEPYIKRAIKREIITKLYGQTGMYEEMILKSDPAVREALDLIMNDDNYSGILKGETSKAEL